MSKALWRLEEIEQVLDAPTTAYGTDVSGVSIDTRTLSRGDMFIALRGDNFDGHNFLEQAVRGGASLCIVEYIPECIDALAVPCVVVNDCYQALEKLALHARKRTRAKIVAVTGSVGKTSAKEALKMVLGAQGSCYATQGNLNNHIGVPLSLVRLPENTDYGVFELGMNHAGEISPLSVLLRPDIALITAIEAVHIEFFDDIEGIVDAKCEIMDGLLSSGVVVIPYGRFEQQMQQHALKRKINKVVTFGEGNTDYTIKDWRHQNGGMIATIDCDGEEKEISLKGRVKHKLFNALLVLSVVKNLAMDMDKALHSLAKIESAEGRGKDYHLTEPVNMTLIDDSYNASPASMKAALEDLAYRKVENGKKKVAILGDMLELGTYTQQYHEELAEVISECKIDKVFLVGKAMTFLVEVLPAGVLGKHYKDYNAFKHSREQHFHSGDNVLVKGSHGSEVWRIVDDLLQDNKS